MAMFAWCGTKSLVVTKRMTQCGVAEIDIGLLIGRPSLLKSTSASQEMSRWNLLSCHLLKNTQQTPTPPPSPVERLRIATLVVSMYKSI